MDEDSDLAIKPRIIAGDPPLVIAEMAGKLNASTAPIFERFAEECVKRGMTRVVLHVPNLKYMGSTGFDKAVEFAGKCQDAGGGVGLVNASAKIQVVLKTLSLESLIRIHASMRAAVAVWRPEDAAIIAAAVEAPRRPTTMIPAPTASPAPTATSAPAVAPAGAGGLAHPAIRPIGASPVPAVAAAAPEPVAVPEPAPAPCTAVPAVAARAGAGSTRLPTRAAPPAAAARTGAGSTRPPKPVAPPAAAAQAGAGSTRLPKPVASASPPAPETREDGEDTPRAPAAVAGAARPPAPAGTPPTAPKRAVPLRRAAPAPPVAPPRVPVESLDADAGGSAERVEIFASDDPVDLLPTFEALAKQLGGSVWWVFREDLRRGRRGWSVRVPLPAENAACAQAMYEAARVNGKGIVVRMPISLDRRPCAWLEIGGPPRFAVDRPKKPVAARAETGGFSGWLRGLLGGGGTPPDEVPSREG